MLILNGKAFAENDKEFTSSLFEHGGTCVGYVKYNKKSVTLLDMQKQKIGVINRHGVLCSAVKIPENGRYWYSLCDIKQIGKYNSYRQEWNECHDALERCLGNQPTQGE